MKTGPQPMRLSEKLNTELENIRQNHAALMESQLTSFKTDLTAIVQNARDTIEADLSAFLEQSKSTLQERLRAIKQSITFAPLMVTVCLISLIGLCMIGSYHWTKLLSSMIVRRRMIWNSRADLVADGLGSSGLCYAALR